MKRTEVADHLQTVGVIAILRKIPPDDIMPVTDALVAGGIKAVEVTMESIGAQTAIEQIRERYEDHLMVGAGTVMSVQSVDTALAAGAQFLLSPHLDTQVMGYAAEKGVLMIPGVLTPTEIAAAQRAGAIIMKVFPAGSVGISYLKDLLGPFSGSHFLPTGGVTPDNAADFIKAGAIGVGMGSSLIAKNEVLSGNWDAIAHRVRHVLENITHAKL